MYMSDKIKVKIKTLDEVLKIEWKTNYLDVGSPWISWGMKHLFWNIYNTTSIIGEYYHIEWRMFKKKWVDIEIEKINYNITIKI